MTLQDAQQAKDNGTLVVARKYEDGEAGYEWIDQEQKYVDQSAKIVEILAYDLLFIQFNDEHKTEWPLSAVDFATDPNPALTEALEAISWPVRWYELDGTILDNDGKMILMLNERYKRRSHFDALSHMIAGMLNEVKRK